mgnify:CR=1 FL=1|tara:strand:+ start:1297 stop:1815 length:519 start_codon:yes stop_codon:yes gene_type:complete
MSKIKIFLILSGYQLTWLICVFGELLYQSSFPGLISGIIFLLLFFINSENKKRSFNIIFFISIVGYLFDSILVNLEIYDFNTSLNVGVLPIWMLVLWPSFASLFDEVLVFLSKYKLIALMLSGSLGPLTYYSGSPLGLIDINNYIFFFILMIFFWIFLMLFYLNFLLRLRLN